MKKLLISCVILLSVLIGSTSNAQKLALEFGYTNPDRFGNGISSTYLNGNRVGLTSSFKLKKNFSLLTGVLYTVVHGDKKQTLSGTKSAQYTSFGRFIDVPLHVKYTQPLFKNVQAFVTAGPNLSYGLSQSQSIISTRTDVTSGVIDLYSSKLRRLNVQLGFTGGFQWKHFQLKTGYDWGIVDLNKSTGNNIFQRGWSLSVGYEF